MSDPQRAAIVPGQNASVTVKNGVERNTHRVIST